MTYNFQGSHFGFGLPTQATPTSEPPRREIQTIRTAVDSIRRTGEELLPDPRNIEQRRAVIELSTQAVTALMQTLRSPDNGDAILDLMNQSTPSTRLFVIIRSLNEFNIGNLERSYEDCIRSGRINATDTTHLDENALALTSPLSRHRIITNALMALTPAQRTEFISVLFPQLSPEEMTALIPRQAILPSTYLKLMASASLATFLFSQWIRGCGISSTSRSTKILAIGSCVSAAAALAPTAIGLRETEKIIHKLETDIHRGAVSIGRFMKTTALRIKNHVGANQKTYLTIASAATLTAFALFTYKNYHSQSGQTTLPPTAETVSPPPAVQIESPITPPPMPEPELIMPELNLRPTLEPSLELTRPLETPLLKQTVEQIIKGTVLDPVLRLSIFANQTFRKLWPYADHFVREVIPSCIRSEEAAKGRF